MPAPVWQQLPWPATLRWARHGTGVGGAPGKCSAFSHLLTSTVTRRAQRPTQDSVYVKWMVGGRGAFGGRSASREPSAHRGTSRHCRAGQPCEGIVRVLATERRTTECPDKRHTRRLFGSPGRIWPSPSWHETGARCGSEVLVFSGRGKDLDLKQAKITGAQRPEPSVHVAA
jgi:hypothetical protein